MLIPEIWGKISFVICLLRVFEPLWVIQLWAHVNIEPVQSCSEKKESQTTSLIGNRSLKPIHYKLTLLKLFNPGPAEPRYALPLQTV